MSQANFMRNLRMTMPQYITNVTSFNDSVKILKNKGILNEVINPSELAMGIKIEMEHTDDPAMAKKIAMDHLAENPRYYSELKSTGIDTAQGLKSTIDSGDTNLNKANPRDGFSLGFFEGENDDKISKYESYTYTLNGKVVKPEIAFYNNILKAEVDGELYRIGQPVNDKIELSPIKGKTGTYTEGIHDRDIMSSVGMAGHVNSKHNDDAYARMVNKPIVKDIAKEMSDSEFKKLLQDFKYEEFWVGDVNATIDSLPIQALRDIAWEFMKPGSIREAKDSFEGKWKTVTGKDLYAQFREIDNLNGQEVLIGIDYEIEKNPELSKAAAAKIVIKNLKKNPIYYTSSLMAGKEGHEPEYIGGKSANPEARQMQYLDKNMGNVVDKKMGMQPVKGIEKAKKDSDKATAEKYKTSGIDLMSLVAKTVRGVKKMDATGEKMKKISVKENQNTVPKTIFDRNATLIKNTTKIGKGEEIEKRKLTKDDLIKMIREELKEIFDGMEPMVRTGLDEMDRSEEEVKAAAREYGMQLASWYNKNRDAFVSDLSDDVAFIKKMFKKTTPKPKRPSIMYDIKDNEVLANKFEQIVDDIMTKSGWEGTYDI